jgi:hypothetical protein
MGRKKLRLSKNPWGEGGESENSRCMEGIRNEH